MTGCGEGGDGANGQKTPLVEAQSNQTRLGALSNLVLENGKHCILTTFKGW